MTTAEKWRPVPSLPGYEASNLGRVRSLRRQGHPVVRKSHPGPCGFHTITVADTSAPTGLPTRRVGTLVAEAWLGPRPEVAEVRRLDGDPLNDRLENLAYGTLEEVHADHAARARREEAAGGPTHCPEGHRYADSWLGAWGSRMCSECARVKRCACGAPRPPRRKRCPDCQAAHRAEMNRQRCRRAYLKRKAALRPATLPCSDCGAEVPQNESGPLVKRCAACVKEARRARDARYRARRAELGPRVSYCIDCGVKIVNQGPGPLAQRCKPHKMLAHREAARRHRAAS